MKSTRPPAPTFYKNDLVRPTTPTNAWRRMTPEENHAWYERFHEDCRAGRDVWHDSAGEPRLAPCDTYFTLTPEMTLTVVRGRASAPLGYGSQKDCALVFCPDNGQTLYVSRRALTNKW